MLFIHAVRGLPCLSAPEVIVRVRDNRFARKHTQKEKAIVQYIVQTPVTFSSAFVCEQIRSRTTTSAIRCRSY